MPQPKMRLMHATLSPFARKVLVAAKEKGMESQIDIVPTSVGHGKINVELMEFNPIGKIPTLVTGDGTAIYDSLVIIDYFDEIQPNPRMIPASGPQRLRSLRLNAIADGLLVAGVLAKTESTRPPEKQWAELLEAQMAKVRKCFEALDGELKDAPPRITIGEIAAGCALGWADMRLAEENWRARLPGLEAWFDGFANRESMKSTDPRG